MRIILGVAAALLLGGALCGCVAVDAVGTAASAAGTVVGTAVGDFLERSYKVRHPDALIQHTVVVRLRIANYELRLPGHPDITDDHKVIDWKREEGALAIVEAVKNKLGLGEGFTSKYRVNRLVYFIETNDIASAYVREKQIKGWTRIKKVRLIESMNPHWEDLSVDFVDLRGM